MIPASVFPLCKKVMRRIIFSFVAMCAMISCGIHEIGGIGNGVGDGIWGGIQDAPEDMGGLHTVCYMTALDYQKDYDWRADQARENVKCSLVVFADGKPVLKVPVGASHEIGSDPDMHRMIDGHLYTDYSTDTHTVIKKDGVLLFRYPGPEAICGMEIIGEDIFTLGESRSGDGFALRRNGEAIFERDAGGVIGEFINDNDCLCFAFYEPVKNTDGQICRYYAYGDGNVSQVAVRDDIKEVWDILVNKDRVRYVADLTGLTAPVIVDGPSMTGVALPVGASMVSCRLFSVAGDTGLEGICRLKTGSMINAVWIDGYMLEAFDDTNWISASGTDGYGVFCAINPATKDGSGLIYHSGDAYDMPEGYAVMGKECLKMIDGILHVGLSSRKGCKPVLWKDGDVDTLNINGYIATIYP